MSRWTVDTYAVSSTTCRTKLTGYEPRLALDPWFVNHTQNQRDEVHDEAVKDGNKSHLEAAGYDIQLHVIIPGQEIRDLKECSECPEYAHDQSRYADFLNPGGSLPCSEEQGYEKKADDDHTDTPLAHPAWYRGYT